MVLYLLVNIMSAAKLVHLGMKNTRLMRQEGWETSRHGVVERIKYSTI